jgi:hypothetical protein
MAEALRVRRILALVDSTKRPMPAKNGQTDGHSQRGKLPWIWLHKYSISASPDVD